METTICGSRFLVWGGIKSDSRGIGLYIYIYRGYKGTHI